MGFTTSHHTQSSRAQEFLNDFLQSACFFPTDFSKAKDTYNTSHTLLSPRSEPSNPLNISFKKDIIVKVFIGKLDEREVEWHFAYQESLGRVKAN